MWISRNFGYRQTHLYQNNRNNGNETKHMFHVYSTKMSYDRRTCIYTITVLDEYIPIYIRYDVVAQAKRVKCRMAGRISQHVYTHANIVACLHAYILRTNHTTSTTTTYTTIYICIIYSTSTSISSQAISTYRQ